MDKKIVSLGEKTNLTKKDVKKLTNIGFFSGLMALTMAAFTGMGSYAVAQEKDMPEKGKPTAERSQKCSRIPEKGDCKALFTTYHYDAVTNRCVEAMGCVSSVFNTKEECNKACVVNKKGDDAYIGHKYGGVGMRDFR